RRSRKSTTIRNANCDQLAPRRAAHVLKDDSFREKNWFLIALAPQSLENIFSETAVRIDGRLWSVDCIHIAHFAQPFFVSARRRFAQRTIRRSVGERKTIESGERLKRFPRIKTHCGVRVGQRVDHIMIEAVPPGDVCRASRLDGT